METRSKVKKQSQQEEISKYLIKRSTNKELDSTNTDSMAANEGSALPESTCVSVSSESALQAMEERLLAAIQGLNTKLAEKVQEIKEDFLMKIESVSKTLSETCKKVGDLEVSVNYAHKDISRRSLTRDFGSERWRQRNESVGWRKNSWSPRIRWRLM